jgi:hypothetical protein
LNVDAFGSLFADGRAVDAILVLVGVEAVALTLVHRLSGRGVAPADLFPNLVSGTGLLLALRAALVDAPWPWIAASLSLGLVGHVADLARRRG